MDKAEYISTLKQTVAETENYCRLYPSLRMYENLLNQLLFIKKIIVDENRIPRESESESLTLGSIAVKNFDYETDPYARLLMTCYSVFLRLSDSRIEW